MCVCHVFLSVCMFTYLHMYMCTCVLVDVCAYVHVCGHLCVYMYVLVCTHVEVKVHVRCLPQFLFLFFVETLALTEPGAGNSTRPADQST